MPGPLVVTLELDAVSRERFERERGAHFPPGRTAVGAHVTLFHALPPGLEPEVRAALVDSARRAPFRVTVGEPYSLGAGVAYPLRSSELHALHGALQERWWEHLTRQDRQPFRPHVTVQNKVSPEVARRTLALLRASFQEYDVRAVGLQLWRYEGGPWGLLDSFRFGDTSR